MMPTRSERYLRKTERNRLAAVASGDFEDAFDWGNARDSVWRRKNKYRIDDEAGTAKRLARWARAREWDDALRLAMDYQRAWAESHKLLDWEHVTPAIARQAMEELRIGGQNEWRMARKLSEPEWLWKRTRYLAGHGERIKDGFH